MFTGIIISVGELKRVSPAAYGARLTISADKEIQASISDSVAINGVCLTLTAREEGLLHFDCVRETLNRSTLGSLKPGSRVNLETALRVGDSLGGHFVQGHVDVVGRISGISSQEADRAVRVDIPPDSLKYVAEKGSIAIDGISLTVASLNDVSFTVKIVPYTWEETNLPDRRIGDEINVETDVLAKYVSRLLNAGKEGLTQDFLEQAGF